MNAILHWHDDSFTYRNAVVLDTGYILLNGENEGLQSGIYRIINNERACFGEYTDQIEIPEQHKAYDVFFISDYIFKKGFDSAGMEQLNSFVRDITSRGFVDLNYTRDRTLYVRNVGHSYYNKLLFVSKAIHTHIKYMSDEEATALIHDLFGFEKKFIKIIHEIEQAEINVNTGEIRVTGAINRRPIFISEKCFYVRFDIKCGNLAHNQYEAYYYDEDYVDDDYLNDFIFESYPIFTPFCDLREIRSLLAYYGWEEMKHNFINEKQLFT